MVVDAAENVFEAILSDLEDARDFAICMSCGYDRGHSPISRAVYPSVNSISDV